ncbi:MAG: sigma 54-interacting transcriptional regulator [Proteobacteria bacterium]|nr:sigma 54-interacting transcriptional regulator [Pseudomonadota bacterium]
MPDILDLTRDLASMRELSARPGDVDRLLDEALSAFRGIVPFDLATIMELHGDALEVRVASGELASSKVRQHSLQLTDFPSIRAVLERGGARAFHEHDHADGDGDPFDGVLDFDHGHACMVVPLRSGGDALGLMTVDRSVCQPYDADVVALANVFGQLLAMALVYGEQSGRLDRMARQLTEQNRLLRERVEGPATAGGLLERSRSPAMRNAVLVGKQVARAPVPVLITGETGTGKEVFARAVHEWSLRTGPLVSINCAALPATLIESELFGHVKGAFSGAHADRIGRFRAANGGTLFLDEVGEIPMELQAKLLRAVEEGCFEPVGSDRTVRVDVRIVAATNVDLETAIGTSFREDLYYRLAVVPVRLPPLRARPEDIDVIVDGFIAQQAPGLLLSTAERAELRGRDWPGNVRQLLHVLERRQLLGELGPTMTRIPVRRPEPEGPLPTLVEAEKAHIEAALRRCAGKVYGEGGAAQLLAIPPSTLKSRMQKLGLGGAREARRRYAAQPGGTRA